MYEKPSAFETNLEEAPRMEQIVDCFKELTGGRSYTDITYENDARGLLTWDIRVSTPDEANETIECWYKRGRTIGDKDLGLAKKIPPRIHTLVCDADGVPTGAGRQFDFVDGKWVEVG